MIYKQKDGVRLQSKLNLAISLSSGILVASNLETVYVQYPKVHSLYFWSKVRTETEISFFLSYSESTKNIVYFCLKKCKKNYVCFLYVLNIIINPKSLKYCPSKVIDNCCQNQKSFQILVRDSTKDEMVSKKKLSHTIVP
jgi:hypothetical protein